MVARPIYTLGIYQCSDCKCQVLIYSQTVLVYTDGNIYSFRKIDGYTSSSLGAT